MNCNHTGHSYQERFTRLDKYAARMFKARSWLGAIALSLGLTVSLAAHAAQAGDVLDVINHDPSYSVFANLLQKTGLDSDLRSGGVYTVFAPTNSAFDELPPERRQHLFDTDSAAARRALESLVVAKKVTPQELAHNRVLLTSVGGHGVVVDGTEGRLTAEGTEILSVDTSPTNGVIYTIDGVTLDHHHSGGRDND